MSDRPPAVATTRVARDVGGPRTEYDDIEVGADLGTMALVITQEAVDRHTARLEDPHPAYSLGSEMGSTIAPLLLTYGVPRHQFSNRYNVRGLFYRWDFQMHRPIRVGEALSVHTVVSNKYVRRDREYVSYASTARDASGELVFTTTRTHVMDYVTRQAPRHGEGLDSGRSLSPEELDATTERRAG